MYLYSHFVPGEDDVVSGSEEDKLLLSGSDTLLALPSIDLGGDNFSRRFERKSWRERHEQQKKLIKQRFEVSPV